MFNCQNGTCFGSFYCDLLSSRGRVVGTGEHLDVPVLFSKLFLPVNTCATVLGAKSTASA